MSMEQLEVCSIRLGKRLCLFKDYAQVLLVSNNWDEDYVARQWDLPGNCLTSYVNPECSFVRRIVHCQHCNLLKTCNAYGCQHFVCEDCVKGYVEENITAGVLNIKCRLDQCEVMLCSSAFLGEVSLSLRKRFNNNLLRSFKLAHPNASLLSIGCGNLVNLKWFLLAVFVCVGLYFRSKSCEIAFKLQF